MLKLPKTRLNGSSIPPTHWLKDAIKAARANCFIGQGSPYSSTAAYAAKLIFDGAPVNKGHYDKNDIVFISVEGNRSYRKPFDKQEVDLALQAGATFITDDPANRHRAYNVGERELAAYLVSQGYKEVEPGIWKP